MKVTKEALAAELVKESQSELDKRMIHTLESHLKECVASGKVASWSSDFNEIATPRLRRVTIEIEFERKA